MATKCPKCHTENPDTLKFCGECGAQLLSVKGTSPVITETIKAPLKGLTRGSLFARRYEIIEELGKGGMGKVYRVFDQKIDEEVALKLIKPEIAADAETIKRFSNELKLARKIAHRNVGKMYELMEEEGAHFITMEYVPGENLKSMIRMSGQLGIGTAVSVAKQICEGLSEAHRLGVVHRDLKPSNIMIDKEGSARIMDFGIARSLKAGGITGAGTIIGTPEYMSPEQVEGKEVDGRSDIYSLGIVLFEMTTGRLPFEGDTPLSIAVKQKSETPKDPKSLNAQIPQDLSGLILKCLEKEKESRYQTAEELLSELAKIEKGIPTAEKVVPRTKPLTSREITVTFGLKKLFVPALVFLILVIAGIVIWHVLPRKSAVLAPKIENSIAVISFKNQTGDKSYDYLQEAIPELLITNLEQTGYIYVVTWERMYDLLKQIGREGVEIIDRDLGFEVCRREGIKFIALGSLIKAGDIFALDVKVLDVETKRLLKTGSSKGEGVDSILETQIDQLSRDISQGIGIPEKKIEAAQIKVEDITTKSMEAYSYFLRGREARDKLEWIDGQKFLEKAIELDPSFASAYLELSVIYVALGKSEAQKMAIEKARAYSQKASEKEKLYIERAYAGVIEGNREKALSLSKQIAEKYPKEKRIYYDIGMNYEAKGLIDDAIKEYNKALELDPNWRLIINQLGYAYAWKGDFDKAVEYLKRYVEIQPGDANAYGSLAEINFWMGRLDEAIVKLKEALKTRPDSSSALHLAYIYGLKENYNDTTRWVDYFISMQSSASQKAEGYLWKAFYHYWLGSLDKTLADLERATVLAEKEENDLWKAYADWMKAWVYYDRGDFEASQRNFKEWFDTITAHPPASPSPGKQWYAAAYSFYLGLLDLKQGKTDAVISRMNEMKQLLPEIRPIFVNWMKFYYDLLQVEAMLAAGKLEDAISAGQRASSLGRPHAWFTRNLLPYSAPFLKDALARAYLKKGQRDKAMAEYERLITFDPNRTERILIYPKYYYWLAKLYEEKRQQAKAKENYQKFLELWKDADPGLPEVEDARERLAVLKG